jgi:subtilisin-like proprotein convertase family protein
MQHNLKIYSLPFMYNTFIFPSLVLILVKKAAVQSKCEVTVCIQHDYLVDISFVK